jgi:transposase
MINKLDKSKIDLIRKDFLQAQVRSAELAKTLGITYCTVNKYRKEFSEIARLYPEKLHNYGFLLPLKKYIKPVDPRHEELHRLLPGLMENSRTTIVNIRPLWLDYRAIRPEGFYLATFMRSYLDWKKRTGACVYTHRRIRTIADTDRPILESWLHSNRKDQWEMAVVLLGSFEKRNLKEMAAQVGHVVPTLLNWLEKYQRTGMVNLIHKPAGANAAIKAKGVLKDENILKLLHESPKLHGLNRTAWRLEDIARVYQIQFGERIGATTVATRLKKMGFGFAKSRELLTSPDPKFREKVQHIQDILANLGEDERFFSVDEYGHFSVKIRGGRSLVKNGERKIIPSLQKSKGFLIVTAALELSTNQVTHFYSRNKDTAEMIKLIDLLILDYRTAKKLYFSWDKASWHASKKLYERITEINSEAFRAIHQTPLVELAPLPASAQFLNVIESVFSGLAKAVIHNSDYQSLDECMAAIDRHFKERNTHFLQHPKKAGGNYIWGKERVAPVFSETNTCRYNRM